MKFLPAILACLMLLALGTARAASPLPPEILEPNIDGAVVSSFDVHMAIRESFTDPDGHSIASTDWEILLASNRSLQWSAYAISDLRIWHVHFGDGQFASADRTALNAQTSYVLRVRFRDSAGEASAWTERPFTTGRLEEIFPLLLTDIQSSPTPVWVDLATSGNILLQPATQPHEMRMESCCSELFYRRRGPDSLSGSVTNPGPIAQDKALRATFQAGSTSLVLPASRFSFTDGRLANRSVYLPPVNLPPGQSVSFWVSITGSAYADESGTNEPTFGELVQGAPVSWIAEQPGYIVEVVSTGYQLPTAICFVPQPSPDPTAPKYYVGELFGKIKAVANNGTVSDFATGLLNYTPDPNFPGSGEMGIADIAVHPQTGEIFVSMVYRASSVFYGGVYRLPSDNGGRSMTGSPVRIFTTFPNSTGPSHQISNLSFDADGHLLVHVGDGFAVSAALNLSDPRGKILRMSTTGQPLRDNPFYDNTNGLDFTDYVFSYGYRNAFGGDWRHADRMLYTVENGTNANDRLARAEAGQNYGWNGNDSSMLIRAIHTWVTPVAPVNLAFIQPEVFGGSSFPTTRQGRAYVTESGPTYATGPQAHGKRVTEFSISPTGQKLSGPVTFVSYQGSGRSTAAAITAGPDGLYFSDLYNESGSNPVAAGANILRIRHVGAADFTMQNNIGSPPLRVAFNDTSTVPEPTAWLWDFGDGTTSTLQNPEHSYTRAGTFSVRLTVTGRDGALLTVKNNAVIVGEQKQVLMVVGATTLNGAEEAIRQRLLALNFAVSHLSDSAVTTPDGRDKALVIICSSVLSANVGTKFRQLDVPVLCYESHLFDDLGLTGPVSGTHYGTRTNQTQLLLLADDGDPLVRGLPTGRQTVTTDPVIFSWGLPVAGARISALLDGTDEAAIFRFDIGAVLDGGLIAPARRLGFMLEDWSAQSLNATGLALFDRAVNWTSNLAPQISLVTPPAGRKIRRLDPVTIEAACFDQDGTVTRVDYFANGTLLGTTTTAPHTLTWTPPADGFFDLTARALDDQETSTLSEAVRIEVLSSYDFWSQQYFTSAQLQDPAIGGSQADPDLDGIANLLEYAFGNSPWAIDPSPFKLALHPDGGQVFPSITYSITAQAEINITPEATANLSAAWSSGPEMLTTERLVEGDGYTLFRTRASTPLGAGYDRIFFRLQADLP